MTTRPLRIAIVGSGPSGIFAAEALMAKSTRPLDIDLLDRLPVPFGLARYGVAPDHLNIRSVRRTLEKVFARPGVRFLGNVEVGSDVTVPELHRFYDAIILSYGASRSRQLGIPGEDLKGSIAATDFVAWYCGHPDARADLVAEAVGSARSIVVVGVGNVAIDVARILAKVPSELDYTDMPQHVLDDLAADGVVDIHVLARRGPAQAAFTTKEVRELGELSDADVFVDPVDLVLDEQSEEVIVVDKRAARNLEVLKDWSQRIPAGHRRRIHFRFFSQPVEIIGVDGHVEGVVVERTRVDGTGAAHGTGLMSTIPAELVIRSVGYSGDSLDTVAFDVRRGVVKNDLGRVLLDDGTIVPGEYAAGWLKRGPTGIIGTNKIDATETVAALLEDMDRLPLAPENPGDFLALLSARNVSLVAFEGWQAIDQAETALGVSRGRDRTTIHDRAALIEIAQAATSAPRKHA